ncbi:MAG TPA: hypothetical protein VGJ28_20065 [Micromonosporaceae bacterium]|jgi:hypothetical protein
MNWLLRVITALVPRQWGIAMRAEFASIDDPAARRSFVIGCLLATLRQARLWVAVAAGLVVVTAAFALTAGTASGSLRTALIAYALLVLLIGGTARLSALRPAGPRAAMIRVLGLLLAAVFATAVVVSFAHSGNPGERTTTGVPILAAVSVAYLLGLIVVTAGVPGSDDAGLARALGCGLGVGAVWTAGVLVVPPVTANAGPALLAVLVSMLVVAVLHRRAGAVPLALAAAAVCAVVVEAVVDVVAAWAPVRYIPLLPADNGPLTAAGRVAQSRLELGDPYVAVFFAGALAAVLAIVTILIARRRTLVEPEFAVAEV